MNFCYLKREPNPGGRVSLWTFRNVPGEIIGCLKRHRAKADALAAAKAGGWTVLPDGMTPEQYEYLLEFRRLNPHNWRKKLWTLWYTGLDDSHPICRQLRNTLGPHGLAKFKF